MTIKFDDRSSTIDEHISEFNTGWSRLAATIGGESAIKTAIGVFSALVKCDKAKATIFLATFLKYHKLTISSIAAQQAELSYTQVTSQIRSLIAWRKKTPKVTENESNSEPAAFTAERENIPVCG